MTSAFMKKRAYLITVPRQTRRLLPTNGVSVQSPTPAGAESRPSWRGAKAQAPSHRKPGRHSDRCSPPNVSARCGRCFPKSRNCRSTSIEDVLPATRERFRPSRDDPSFDCALQRLCNSEIQLAFVRHYAIYWAAILWERYLHPVADDDTDMDRPTSFCLLRLRGAQCMGESDVSKARE